MKASETVRVVAIFAILLLVAGCTAGPNPTVGQAGPSGDIAGFWLGLWHGMIVPISFVVSLFNDNVHIYEVYNNGGWYNFGFACGVGGLAGGSTSTSRKR